MAFSHAALNWGAGKAGAFVRASWCGTEDFNLRCIGDRVACFSFLVACASAAFFYHEAFVAFDVVPKPSAR